MPMNKFFTLLKTDLDSQKSNVIAMLESNMWDELFDSEMFLSTLDSLKVEPPSVVSQKLMAFVRAYEVLPTSGCETDDIILN